MDSKPFEENFDFGAFGAATDPEVQKVFELENALPDLPFDEQLGDLKTQGAAGMINTLSQDSISTPSPTPLQPQTVKNEASEDQKASPASLERSVSEEMDELNSDSEAESHPVDPQSEIQQQETSTLDVVQKPEKSSTDLQILNAEFVSSQYVYKRKYTKF